MAGAPFGPLSMPACAAYQGGAAGMITKVTNADRLRMISAATKS